MTNTEKLNKTKKKTDRRTINRFAKQLEYWVAKFFESWGIDAERVPLSGGLRAMKSNAPWIAYREKLLKADVNTEDFFIEVKSTRGDKGFTIKKEDLEKTTEKAKPTGKFPLLIFKYFSDKEPYAVIPLKTWFEMIETKLKGKVSLDKFL